MPTHAIAHILRVCADVDARPSSVNTSPCEGHPLETSTISIAIPQFMYKEHQQINLVHVIFNSYTTTHWLLAWQQTITDIVAQYNLMDVILELLCVGLSCIGTWAQTYWFC